MIKFLLAKLIQSLEDYPLVRKKFVQKIDLLISYIVNGFEVLVQSGLRTNELN